MSTEKVDVEIEAIKTLLTALEPLEERVRQSVIEYVLKRLGLHLPLGPQQAQPLSQQQAAVSPPPRASQEGKRIDQLKEEKKPQSAIEMAAIVAYYLSELAPVNERKELVTAKDMRTYFKIAGFKLPEVRFLLPNAKNAGYFDSAGTGQYRLNAVGYNLVAHNMPRSSSESKVRTRRVRKSAKGGSRKRK